jgi:hypothetical protein
LTILNDEFESGKYEWGPFPKSIGQFVFYTKAVESSPEVFKDTNKLDTFRKFLEKPEYKKVFLSLNKSEFLSLPKGKELLIDLDKNLESRARHYTSNLNNENLPYTDSFEKILPINSINLILLRQLAKLRIYSRSGEMYYSPFNLLMYILLNHNRVSDEVLFKMIELLNPSFPVEPTEFVANVLSTSFEEVQLQYNDKISGNNNFPVILEKMDLETFSKYFTSQKASEQVEVYYDFYTANYNFFKEKTQENLDVLISPE